MKSALSVLQDLNSALKSQIQGEPLNTATLSAIQGAIAHLGLECCEGVEEMLVGDIEICLSKPDTYYLDVTKNASGKWSMSIQYMGSDAPIQDVTSSFSHKEAALIMGVAKMLAMTDMHKPSE
jgi:hypothetical protein